MKYSKIIKYLYAINDGIKVPRKAKKLILGRKLSKKELRERIKQVKRVGPHKTIYDGFGLNDNFCPHCGCEEYIMTDNKADYPELWVIGYCARCGAIVFEADNSPYHHVLEDMIDDEVIVDG